MIMMSQILILLGSTLIFAGWSALPAAADRHNLTFMLITSFGQFGFNSSGALPAADMALEDINDDPNILIGYNLVYDEVRDSQCLRGQSLDKFFMGILSKPVKLAVVGCGCSVATEPVAEISHRWNISQISYASGLAALSDRSRFPRYFRNSPTFEIVSPALHSTLEHFKWRRIALITQRESLFTGAESSFRRELEPFGIEIGSRVFKTEDDPITMVKDIFLEADDYRVFILNCYSGPAKRIVCEAAKRALTYPKYVWIAYDWYPQGWWKQSLENGEGCDSNMLQTFLERVISLRRYPAPDDSSVKTDAGITPESFHNEYSRRAIAGGFDIVDAGVRLYDVMWVLAQALNNTVAMIERSDINHTNCIEVMGELVPLEQFNYTNEKMGCLLQWNLQQTNFLGGSGHIIFDENGTRIHHRVRLRQYLFDETGNLTRQRFAYLDRTDNYTFTFEPGLNDDLVFPDGIPLDGTPMTVIHTFKIGLVVVFDSLATLGILFAMVCLLFNFIFRKRKIVKLTSPSVNYFIIVGAVLMYISIYFFMLPNTNEKIVLARCILQHCLFTIGYSLAFGMVLAKMWRIYHIFHNPSPNKKILKDWHLVVVTMSVTGLTIFLLLLEMSIPLLRGTITKEKDQEQPTGSTVLGIRQEFCIMVCYEASSPSFFWQIFLFTYLVVLQIVGIILSFQTRKVKIQGLRDSKFIATIIYISSIVLVMLALVTFSLRTYINIGAGMFVTGIFILTTTFLALIFIPKMVLLYNDPDGVSVMGESNTPCSLDRKLATRITTIKAESELEKIIKEKDDTIVRLKSEIMMMKSKENDTNGENEEDMNVASDL